MGHQIALNLFGVDEVGHAELAAPLFLAGIEINADDHVGTGKARALDDVQADAAEAEHHDV